MKHTSKLFASVAALGLASAAHADQVFLDDLIVDGSACIGLDCANGENFGFDTLRLKENNLRIKFDDTSATASFPNTDWQLTANESTNGGLNKFSIEDTTNGRIPFTVEANAPTNAVYVEDSGNVGIGTNRPTVNVHVVEGNTPTLRLEQDGSAGFSPHTWDLAGNETNFFVRDVSSGSTLPLRIFPSNDNDDGLVIRNSRIGVFTDNPETTLHVRKNNGTAAVLVDEQSDTVEARTLMTLSNNGEVHLRLENRDVGANARWVITHDTFGNLGFNRDGSTREMVLTETGDLRIPGTLTTGGTQCGSGCDAVFEADYEIMPIKARADLMWENGYLPNVGPTIENEPFNVTEKVGRMLNELEHAHIYIAQLNERIALLEEQLIDQ